METILLNPNNSYEFGNLKNIREVEVPIMLSILGLVYNDSFILDSNLSNSPIYETVEYINKISPKNVILFHNSNNVEDSFFKKVATNRLKSLLNNNTNVELISSIPESLQINKQDTLINLTSLDIKKYKCPIWQEWTGTDSSYGSIVVNINNTSVKTDSILSTLSIYSDNNISNIKILDINFLRQSIKTKDILKKIKNLPNIYNICCKSSIDLIDEELLIRAKQAGVKWIDLDIGSGNSAIRKENGLSQSSNDRIKYIIELIHSHGISVTASYTFGFKDDNEDTMLETLNLALQLKCENSNFYTVIATPGSKFYNIAKKNNWETPLSYSDYSQYSYTSYPLQTNYLSSKEVLAFRDSAFDRFYRDLKYLKQIESKFGSTVRKEVELITDLKLKRQLLGD